MKVSTFVLLQEVVGCGTEDVLTCHVIIFREPTTGVTAIAHFDEFSRKWDFEGLMNDFLEKVKSMKEKVEYDYWDEDEWEWEDDEEAYEEAESTHDLDPGINYLQFS